MVVEAVRWVDSMAYIRRLNPSTMTMFREQLLWGSIAVLMLTGVGAYSVWVYFINDEQANDLPLVTTEVATRKTALYYVVEFSADNGACGTYYLTNTAPGTFHPRQCAGPTGEGLPRPATPHHHGSVPVQPGSRT
jgi:hypothetical protein